VPLLGYLAIATGYALAVDIAIVAMLILLQRRHVPTLDLRMLAVGFGKIVAAAVGGGVVGWLAFGLLSPWADGSQLRTLAALAASAVPSLLAYWGLARLLRSREEQLARERVASLLRRSAPAS
jgi:hypothetical protein